MYVLISGPYTCNNNMFYQFKQHKIYKYAKCIDFLSELFKFLIAHITIGRIPRPDNFIYKFKETILFLEAIL